MEWVRLIVLTGGIMLFFGILGAVFASVKNRDASFWTALCFLVPPALIVLLLLPKYKGPRQRRPSLDDEDTMLDRI
jgi:membrane protein implicated in regulation of membrane protease activity